MFFEPGGIRTRRSGLRLLMLMLMGGGDLACMFLLMLPGETSRPGELRWFPYPFPVGQSKRTRQSNTSDHTAHVHGTIVGLSTATTAKHVRAISLFINTI